MMGRALKVALALFRDRAAKKQQVALDRFGRFQCTGELVHARAHEHGGLERTGVVGKRRVGFFEDAIRGGGDHACEMTSSGTADGADLGGVELPNGGVGAHPTHGGFDIVNGGGKRGLGGESIAGADHHVTALSQGARGAAKGVLAASNPAATMNEQHPRQQAIIVGTADVHLHGEIATLSDELVFGAAQRHFCCRRDRLPGRVFERDKPIHLDAFRGLKSLGGVDEGDGKEAGQEGGSHHAMGMVRRVMVVH